MLRFSPARAALATLAGLVLLAAASVRAPAQEPAPALWFQGTRLIFDHGVAESGDIAVGTRDAGLHRFLDKLGASVAFEPQSRYVVVTAGDRRTIVFTIGDADYTAGDVRLRAAFAPRLSGGDVVLPFFAVARALYVEPVADAGETVLQPRIGALDVVVDGGRTIVTLHAAMPLVSTTAAESADHLQLAFVGQGAAVTPARRSPGTALSAIDLSVGGSTRVPQTTLTLDGMPGTTHVVVPGDTPDELSVIFSPRATADAGPVMPPGSDATPVPAPTPMAPIVAGRSTVTDLSIAPASDDSLAVRVTLSGAAAFEWHRLPDHRWYLDLQNTTLTGPGRDEHPSFGNVTSVRVRQTGTDDAPAVRIAFTFSGNDPQVAVEPDATGVTVVVTTVDATDALRMGSGETGGPPVVASSAAPAPVPSETPWRFAPAGSGAHTIVIDPGHGGDDTGTAHNGLVEKTLTFDIAQRLRALLLAQGWTVRMTRDTDIDPVSNDNLARMRADGKPNADDRAYLQTRCDVANAINARLFISIHINSAPFSSAHGTTFYWYKPQDAPFAQALERSVIAAAGTFDDGTRHENFYVIRHTTMPAVLIETAFVTNEGDVELLRTPAFLQSVAQGIANGVKAYAGAPNANSVSAQ